MQIRLLEWLDLFQWSDTKLWNNNLFWSLKCFWVLKGCHMACVDILEGRNHERRQRAGFIVAGSSTESTQGLKMSPSICPRSYTPSLICPLWRWWSSRPSLGCSLLKMQTRSTSPSSPWPAPRSSHRTRQRQPRSTGPARRPHRPLLSRKHLPARAADGSSGWWGQASRAARYPWWWGGPAGPATTSSVRTGGTGLRSPAGTRPHCPAAGARPPAFFGRAAAGTEPAGASPPSAPRPAGRAASPL